jgi:hypothetical protein
MRNETKSSDETKRPGLRNKDQATKEQRLKKVKKRVKKLLKKG